MARLTSSIRKLMQKAFGSKLGSLASGRFIVERKVQKSDLSNARIIDFFGSAATAGTKQQTTARVGAVIYGVAAAGVAAAGASAAGSGAAAGGAAGGSAFASGATVTATSAATSTTAASGWLATAMKTAGTIGLVSKLLSGGAVQSPEYSEPYANFLPAGDNFGSIYPDAGAGVTGYDSYGAPIFSPGGESAVDDSPPILMSPWFLIGGILLVLFILGVAIFRR